MNHCSHTHLYFTLLHTFSAYYCNANIYNDRVSLSIETPKKVKFIVMPNHVVAVKSCVQSIVAFAMAVISVAQSTVMLTLTLAIVIVVQSTVTPMFTIYCNTNVYSESPCKV